MIKSFKFLILVAGTQLSFCAFSFDQYVMSPEEFLNLAKRNDPELQTIMADRLKMKYLSELNLPSREILLSIRQEYGFARDSKPTDLLTASLNKSLLETGTNLSVSKTITKRPDRTEDVTQLRVEQALYKNAFGSQFRELKDNLDRQKSVLELQVIEAYEDYTANLLIQYLDLTQSYLTMEISKRLKKENESLLQSVKKKFKQSIASTTDLKRVQLQAVLREENFLKARATLEGQSQNLLQRSGQNKLQVVVPDTKMNMEDRLTNIDLDIERFLSISRSKVIYDKQEKISEESLKIVKQNLRPEANLLLGFNIDKSKRFATAINREEAVVGLRVDIPFDNSVVEAQIKEASYTLLKSKLAKKTFDNAIRESLFVIRNQIIRQKELLKVSASKKELAAAIVLDQLKRYGYGKVTLENLIEDKNLEAQYEYLYLSEVITFNKLIVQWLALTDQLIYALPEA